MDGGTSGDDPEQKKLFRQIQEQSEERRHLENRAERLLRIIFASASVTVALIGIFSPESLTSIPSLVNSIDIQRTVAQLRQDVSGIGPGFADIIVFFLLAGSGFFTIQSLRHLFLFANNLISVLVPSEFIRVPEVNEGEITDQSKQMYRDAVSNNHGVIESMGEDYAKALRNLKLSLGNLTISVMIAVVASVIGTPTLAFLALFLIVVWFAYWNEQRLSDRDLRKYFIYTRLGVLSYAINLMFVGLWLLADSSQVLSNGLAIVLVYVAILSVIYAFALQQNVVETLSKPLEIGANTFALSLFFLIPVGLYLIRRSPSEISGYLSIVFLLLLSSTLALSIYLASLALGQVLYSFCSTVRSLTGKLLT